MAAGEVEREDVFRVADELSWRVIGPNKRGYFKALCPCGKHKTWVHKTPSNPNYYRQKVNFIRRQDCSAG